MQKIISFFEKILPRNAFDAQNGQLLVELVLAIGLSAIIIPALLTGLAASREGKPQQEKRVQAIALLKETETAVKSIRDDDWTTFTNITSGQAYHPIVSGNNWALSSGSASNSAGFTQQVVVSDVYRTPTGAIASTPIGNTLDPSTKKADITISWTKPVASSLTSSIYLTRTTNVTQSQTTAAHFNAGTFTNVQVVSGVGNDGDIRLANNNKAKWCTPAFNSATIDLPDGPPVAVAASASAVSNTIPNDVFVATAPASSSAIKMAYVNVGADVATPAATLRGKFTMDAAQFSVGYSPQSGTGLTNNFKTTDIAYYKTGNNTYAIIGTDQPDREVIVVWVNDGNAANDTNNTGEYQDPVNKIYKYKTFFNTRRYEGVATNDQSPYGYGASSIAVLGTNGYVASGGFLYVFDLSNVNSATTATSLNMQGCRIELDGYECRAGNPGTVAKYASGQSGTTWTDPNAPDDPPHNDCSDGGNIELKATNDIYPIQTSSETLVFVAIGSATDAEFQIVNVTSIPNSTNSNPLINNSSCGRQSGGNNNWKARGELDFNTQSGTEEAANSVFARADGNRAYISSNGGIDANGNGQPDSRQFYVINTTSKTSPSFIAGTASGPTQGYYYGTGANAELYPRRSMTVLNGERAVLVGSDGTSNGNNAYEYQVVDITDETDAPLPYCGGLDYNVGFNDLTYVSEKDNENYVYMVANTTSNELKIIEGGPDSAIYVESGAFESTTINALNPAAFNRFIASITQPTQSLLRMQVAVAPAVNSICPTAGSAYTFLGPNGDPNAYFTAIGSTITGIVPLMNVNPSYSNPNQCFRYKAFLSTSDQTVTPVMSDIIVNYSL